MRFEPPDPKTLDLAVDTLVSACREIFMDDLVCVTLKGSAIRGDFIPGYSDFDFHVFLRPEVMDGERVPKAEKAIEFQRCFGDADPVNFGASQFQVYFIDSETYPEDWVPPVEGTFRVCHGELPLSARQVEDEVYTRHAGQALLNVERSRTDLVGRFVDKPNAKIAPIVRLLGTILKGYMYYICVLLTSQPQQANRLRLDAMVPIVEEGIGSRGHFSRFYDQVSNWCLLEKDSTQAREAFLEGIEALAEISRWNRTLNRSSADSAGDLSVVRG